MTIIAEARSWLMGVRELTCEELASAILLARKDGLPTKGLMDKYAIKAREEEMVVSLARVKELEAENAALRAAVARVSTDPDYARGFLAQHERDLTWRDEVHYITKHAHARAPRF
jgi:hypothetical protein